MMKKFLSLFLNCLVLINFTSASIDLSAVQPLLSEAKLPGEIKPINYTLKLKPNIEELSFEGYVKIFAIFEEPSDLITLHASPELEIKENEIKLYKNGPDIEHENIKIRRVGQNIKKSLLEIYLREKETQGTIVTLEIEFSGRIWENTEGMFKGSYVENGNENKVYLATSFRPNNARRLYPCFDEPGMKAKFLVSILRPKEYRTLFNTPLGTSENIEEKYQMDHFELTPELSTYSIGFLMSQLSAIERTDLKDPLTGNVCIKVYARKDLHESLLSSNVYERIEKSLNEIKNYFNVDFPLKKLDVVALPNLFTVKATDNFGLIFYKETQLTQNSIYLVAQELVHQWLGGSISPQWFTEFHVNKAFVDFIAVNTAIRLDNGREFDRNWPMTTLYSIYYEFSKRYPHSKITGMKQETLCSKTQLVLRMLNYTLGAETFKKGLQAFLVDRDHKTFLAEDIWSAMTKQAHADKKLKNDETVSAITESWIKKERLPVVTVKRDYQKNEATIEQKLYLRERPHDVPEADKMLWWIPVILTNEDDLDFTKYTPKTWMKKERQIKISNMPEKDKFLIMNAEEVGPFPVNYDETNWNMIANYLQNTEKRLTIPNLTRAKLLHDCWNLAYSGSLNFATALNMTLFMKFEREHTLWNPIFTMIDHIGRHIDISSVHTKFNVYFAQLLQPLYIELENEKVDDEEKSKINLRNLAKTFLCRAGYKPCIEEAQKEFKKWIDSENPDDDNPVANQYICPVFRFGTMAEFEFGVERVVNFNSEKKQSERTYLLKAVAGCPNQPEKIIKLLNMTMLEDDEKLTENDLFLILSMLSGGSTGYGTLIKFLDKNWTVIKAKFERKTNLWDRLISTATGFFTTQEGYDLVAKLYKNRRNEFGSAEHIIEKSMKNIKEEAKWSNENLPVIEKWLDSQDYDHSKFIV